MNNSVFDRKDQELFVDEHMSCYLDGGAGLMFDKEIAPQFNINQRYLSCVEAR